MWTLDDTRPQRAYARNSSTLVPSAAMNNYYAWRRLVRADTHPREAARRVGDLNYKPLSGTTGQYEIRLSQGHRATFTVNESTEQVVVYQIGGHT